MSRLGVRELLRAGMAIDGLAVGVLGVGGVKARNRTLETRVIG